MMRCDIHISLSTLIGSLLSLGAGLSGCDLDESEWDAIAELDDRDNAMLEDEDEGALLAADEVEDDEIVDEDDEIVDEDDEIVDEDDEEPSLDHHDMDELISPLDPVAINYNITVKGDAIRNYDDWDGVGAVAEYQLEIWCKSGGGWGTKQDSAQWTKSGKGILWAASSTDTNGARMDNDLREINVSCPDDVGDDIKIQLVEVDAGWDERVVGPFYYEITGPTVTTLAYTGGGVGSDSNYFRVQIVVG